MFSVTGEIIKGPDGDVLVPDCLELLRPDGFMLRWHQDNQVLVDILGPAFGRPRSQVIGRLAFSCDSFEQFVNGLVAACTDGPRRA
jgi:hypothetical protein